MTGFIKYLESDFLKMKRQPLLLMHIIVPIVGIMLFLAYYSYSPWSPVSKAEGFLEVLAVAFPTMIGIVCSMAVEQEAAAGNFQQMLTSPVKLLPLFSMLTSLLILGFGAVLLAAGGFGAGFIAILHKVPFNLGFYLRAGCILFASSIFLYVFHIIVSLRFGKGASIGVGIMESLVSALFLTGLGNGRWQFVPCAWGGRLVSGFAQYAEDAGSFSNAVSDLHTGVVFCIAGTIAIILFACVWFSYWEGRKSVE